MITLCSDPTCDENAGVTLQRQMDGSPVPYCLTHGDLREAQLKQSLVSYRRCVIVQLPPTELELAQERIAELEGKKAPDAGAGVVVGGADTPAEQLETALRTLELQSKALDNARTELADRGRQLEQQRLELERGRAELQRTRAELERLRAAELERKQPLPPGGNPPPNPTPTSTAPPITPPPPTRPDGSKP